MSKERILELYLNQIYLGSGAYGVAAASLEYFDKSIKELDYAESALLAAHLRHQADIIHIKILKLPNLEGLSFKNLFENNFLDRKISKIQKQPISLKKEKNF